MESNANASATASQSIQSAAAPPTAAQLPISSPPPPPPDQSATADSGCPTADTSSASAPPPDLDPRIQIELENLNTATDNINRLEIELEESNATFRILLNESTRRLKLLSKQLGTSIDKSRPYHEAAERARLAQIACQAAAVQFQRAHEHYAAAKETVALAEARFMSGSHEWQFDNAWQEMLNHATIKVAAAEHSKTECNAEHQRKAAIFSAAELYASQLEDQLRRAVIKSRPYFEEKQNCQLQLQTQKERIEELQAGVAAAKRQYAQALRALEVISEEIHRSRAAAVAAKSPTSGEATVAEEAVEEEEAEMPRGPREPGVGAEKGYDDAEAEAGAVCLGDLPSLNYVRELERCEVASLASAASGATSLSGDGGDDGDSLRSDRLSAAAAEAAAAITDDATVEQLRQHMKQLAVRPVEGGDGQPAQDADWETELNATVERLDRLLMQREKERPAEGKLLAAVLPALSEVAVSLPSTPMRGGGGGGKVAKSAATESDAADTVVSYASIQLSPVRRPSPVRQLLKAEPLPAGNVSMRELPLLSRLQQTEVVAATSAGGATQKRRRSLE